MVRLFIALLFWTAHSANANELTAQQFIAEFNKRPFGQHGTQHVTLDLINGNTLTKRFKIQNSWRVISDGVDALFLLNQPRGLAGTSYLLRERQKGMSVYLHLPVGMKRVAALSPAHFGRGLLGSDFSYHDVRFQLPTVGVTYTLAGENQLIGRSTYVLEAKAEGTRQSELGWKLARFQITTKPFFLLGADYYHDPAAGPIKRLRVNNIAKIEGVWIATEMTMRTAYNRWSRMTLDAVDFLSPPYPNDTVAPSGLPELAAKARSAAFATQTDTQP